MSDSLNNLHSARTLRQRLLRLSRAMMVAFGVTVVAAVLAAILNAGGDDRGGHAVAVFAWSSAAVVAVLTLMLLLLTVRVVAAQLEASDGASVESTVSTANSQRVDSGCPESH